MTPASAREALDMVRAGLGYLAVVDAAQLPAATQAEFLRELEQADAAATAARAWFLAAFTAGQGPAGDGDYSAVSWLMHRTGITKGAAVGHSAWAKRVATHPRVIAALGAGQVSESVGRLVCLWTDKLPLEFTPRRFGTSLAECSRTQRQ
jgi:cytochrome c5